MPNIIIQPPVWPPQQQLQQVPPIITTVQEPRRHKHWHWRYPHHSPRHFHHVPQVQPVRGPDRRNVARGRRILLRELRVPTRILQQGDDIIALPRIAPQGCLPSIIVPRGPLARRHPQPFQARASPFFPSPQLISTTHINSFPIAGASAIRSDLHSPAARDAWCGSAWDHSTSDHSTRGFPA
jgi:hypothetical protein